MHPLIFDPIGVGPQISMVRIVVILLMPEISKSQVWTKLQDLDNSRITDKLLEGVHLHH